MSKVAVICYSATGTNHAIAQAVGEGAASAGAESPRAAHLGPQGEATTFFHSRDAPEAEGAAESYSFGDPASAAPPGNPPGSPQDEPG